MREVVMDFETASGIDLKEVGAWRYSEDVTTEVISLAFNVDAGAWSVWDPSMPGLPFIELAADPNTLFISHGSFDKAIWRNIMVPIYGCPDIPNSRWDCTLAGCAMRALPLDLDRATIVLRLPQHKDTEGSKITKSLSKPNRKGYYDRNPAVLNRVYAYNGQDVLATTELRKRIGPMPAGERQVWLLDQRINERGIRLDLPFVEKAQSVVDRASPPLVKEFMDITGGLKPSQNIKVRAWVNAQGVKISSLGKEIVAALLGEEDENGNEDSDMDIPELPDLVRRALVIRGLVGSASVKKLKRMQACVCADGRARGLLQYHGASPGRWAGRLLQPQNFPRGSLKDSLGEKPKPEVVVNAIMSGDNHIVEMTLGPPVESVVSSLRHAIISDPGRELMSGDFMTIEARIVLALAGQHDKTEIMAQGKDIYCDMAQQIYKRPIDKKKDPEERQTGKNSVLGLGFQMGWKKFKFKYGKGQTDDFCQNIVRTYREDWAPKVPELWDALGKAAMDTVHYHKPNEAYGVLYQLEDGWLTARIPSGRKLWYFNPQMTRRAMPWDETDIRLAWSYQQMKMGQWKTIYAFGGLLTENVVQALARDLMVSAMFKLEKAGFPIVLTVHDEIVCEPKRGEKDVHDLVDIMRDMPVWARNIGVPIDIEAWVGDRYRK